MKRLLILLGLATLGYALTSCYFIAQQEGEACSHSILTPWMWCDQHQDCVPRPTGIVRGRIIPWSSTRGTCSADNGKPAANPTHLRARELQEAAPPR